MFSLQLLVFSKTSSLVSITVWKHEKCFLFLKYNIWYTYGVSSPLSFQAHDLLRARWLSLARHRLRVSPRRDENSASRHDVRFDASLREDDVNNDNDYLDGEMDGEEKKNGNMDEKTEKMGDKAEGMEVSATKRITEECICPAVSKLNFQGLNFEF